MKVQVPFVFEAEVIHKGCRSASTEFIADIAHIDIPELTDLRLAASVDDDDYYVSKDSLYLCIKPTHKEDREEVSVSTEEWAKELGDFRSTRSPCQKHDLAAYRQAITRYDELWTQAKIEAEQPFREYLSDNRLLEQAKLQNALPGYAIHAGRVFREIDEPVYMIRTLGLGKNQGGTQVVIEAQRMARLWSSQDWIFNLSQREQAIQRAESVALNRGDDKCLPVKPKEQVRVYLPEAFKFDPFSREELRKGRISLADYLEHNGEITHKATQLIDRTAANVAQGLKNAEIAEQVAWLQDRMVDPQTIMKAFTRN